MTAGLRGYDPCMYVRLVYGLIVLRAAGRGYDASL